MEALSLAISVAEMPRAIPTSALCKEGAIIIVK